MKRFAFAVPGDLATPTGGYAYDRRMISELGRLGWQIDVINLGEGFPSPDDKTRKAAAARLLDIPDGWTIVVDGLALGVLPETASQIGGHHPLVALIHHPLAFETGLSAEQTKSLRVSERAALAATRSVIATSHATARQLTADYAVPAERIVVAPPGTDPVPFAQGSQDGIVRLLSVGAVVPRKGYDVLIAALSMLPDLSWRLTIAGDRTRNPKTADELDTDIVRRGLADHVSVLGAVSSQQLAELYAEADVFTLPSRFEGYGMAFAEAIAHGLPVVGTTAGAIPATVPRDASLLVAPDDASAFADALRHVISDADERRRLSRAARAAAGQLPSWQQSTQIFARALEAIA